MSSRPRARRRAHAPARAPHTDKSVGALLRPAADSAAAERGRGRCARDGGYFGPQGAKHFVLLSAICVQKPLLAFQAAKLKFEEALQAAGDISYSIVRPTAFFKSLAAQARAATHTRRGVRVCVCPWGGGAAGGRAGAPPVNGSEYGRSVGPADPLSDRAALSGSAPPRPGRSVHPLSGARAGGCGAMLRWSRARRAAPTSCSATARSRRASRSAKPTSRATWLTPSASPACGTRRARIDTCAPACRYALTAGVAAWG